MSWMLVRGWRRVLYTHPIWLIAGLFLAGMVLLALGGTYADEKERRSFVAYSERLMQTFVERQQLELEKLVRDYAVWDLFAEHVHGEHFDQEWLKKTITESVYRNFEVSDVLVLSSSFKPVFYLHRGQEARLAALSDWNAEFARVVMHDIARQPTQVSFSGFVRKDSGALQLLVAERIRPEHPARSAPGGGWLIFARDIDSKWLEQVSHLLSVKELTLENALPAGGAPRYAMRDPARQPLLWLSWKVDRKQIAGQSGKPLLFGVFVVFLFAWLLARSVLQISKNQLETQERMLLQSEALRRLSHLPGGGVADDAQYFSEIARSVQKVLGADSVVIFRVAPHGDAGECLAACGTREADSEVFLPANREEYFGFLQQSKVWTVDSTREESRFDGFGNYWNSFGVAAELDAGVMVRGRLAGVLRIEMPDEAEAWVPDQVNFACSAAELVAAALVSAERRRTETAIDRQQYYDTLTGLPNHERLNQLLQRHLLESGNRLVYSLWRIEDLLLINEDLGRTGGDLLLQAIARRLDSTPVAHVAARLAGGQFVLALLNLSPAQVSLEIEKMLYQLKEPVEIGEQTVFPRLSCGVSLAPQDALTVDELLRHAEYALDSAREQNDNPIEFYAPEPNTVARERYRLAGAIPAALARGEFELFFLPIVTLESREIVGLEALLRWHHPEKGEISPAQFIPIAEETGQIHELGRFVIEEACRCLPGWIELTGKELQLAINVSPLQLLEPVFPAFLQKTLQDHGISPALLSLELAEAEALKLFESAPDNLPVLREMGVRLAIDDVGTGRLPLASLCRLPVDQLKIDRSLVGNLAVQPQDADLVRLIVSVGQVLGLEVVAEGVETQAQLVFLRKQGCGLAQGYYFSEPVSATGLNLLLEQGVVLEGAS